MGHADATEEDRDDAREREPLRDEIPEEGSSIDVVVSVCAWWKRLSCTGQTKQRQRRICRSGSDRITAQGKREKGLVRGVGYDDQGGHLQLKVMR
jgi:hypothetical protein